MANRAYLFSTDISDINQIKGFEKPYYDSRWNIPLLWFLFFNHESIKIKTCWLEEDPDQDEISWEELLLIENKDLCITRFSKNLKTISENWNQIEKDPEVLNFIEKIKDWNGNNLVLDPSEIIEADDIPKAFETFNKAFDFLVNQETFRFIDTLSEYSGKVISNSVFSKLFSSYQNERVKDSPGYFIGYTYW